MKKWTSLLLAALMAFSCAGALAEATDPLAAYPETITITTARTMTDTAVFDTNNPEKKSYTENRWTNAYLEYLNIDLDYEWVSTDADANMAKWAAAIASGNVPDFARVSDEVYQLLRESEMIADCTAIYEEYASEEYKALLDENALDQLTFGGMLYGLPFPGNGYLNAPCFFVRQDWLDMLGLEYPETMAEIIATAKAFQEAQLGGDDTMALMFSADASDGMLAGFMNMYGAYRDYWVDVDGKLAFSNLQPEMRTALLALQELYAQNLINQDFAVTTADLAKEYIASGKVGIFWSVSFSTTTSIQALYDNDPNAEIVSSVVKGLNGEDILFQTGTPRTGKIFVNKDCEHPEAVMKMLNLAEYLNRVEPYTYGTDETGHMWFKYLPFEDNPKSTFHDLLNAHEISEALKAGLTSGADGEWTYTTNIARFDRSYNSVTYGRDADVAIWNALTYGVNGTYVKLYDAYVAGLHLCNGYVGMPTETQSLMGDVINDKLNTAMYEVIMGADISVYDEACASWLASGGQQITDEINAATGR